ncbi:TenA family transcriptional regulator [Actinomycetaceae bacterium WB03_NA08]|uniref:TenA family transcriptional regulator n=2 Tax=Scrofimicrobium canadense TaxID=2652290 RepID=A0A6N7VP35_9ACTO|nr:TenA family transcriptional regulator [Scrofimicrobium canadense]
MSYLMATFTDELWDASESLRHQIYNLEFLTLLGNGTLPLEDFYFYMYQDSIYLANYSKALALVATHADNSDAGAFWARAASDAAAEEILLHQSVLESDIERIPQRDREPSPTCLAYFSYLVATAATTSYPIGAAAVLPCFWIYADVSSRIADSAKKVLSANPSHPYSQWVAEYDGIAFQESAEKAKEFVNAAAREADQKTKKEMTTAFLRATRYELLFWQTAFDRHPWPSGTEIF